MTVEYTATGRDDIEAIFLMSRELIDTYEDTAAIDYDKVLDWVRRKIEGHINEYVRVAADGRTAGYYRFAPAEGRMELDALYILPEFRCKGIGSQIIRKCCSAADLPVFLYVFAGNRRAIALYERMGFRKSETVSRTRFIMEKEPDAKQTEGEDA